MLTGVILILDNSLRLMVVLYLLVKTNGEWNRRDKFIQAVLYLNILYTIPRVYTIWSKLSGHSLKKTEDDPDPDPLGFQIMV